MALIAVFQAVFKDWRKHLSPGERAIVLLVAADREQAKILHQHVPPRRFDRRWSAQSPAPVYRLWRNAVGLP